MPIAESLQPWQHGADIHAMNVAVAPDIWMRRRDVWTAVGVGIGVLYSIAFLGMGVSAIASWSDQSAGAVLAGALFFTAAASIPMWFAIRASRAALQISPRGVTLRGILKTHHLALSDVERFVPEVQAPSTRSTVGVRIQRRAGRSLIVWAMRSATWAGRENIEAACREWQPVCDELNELLGAMRGQAVPPQS
jgi:hypothetical protein